MYWLELLHEQLILVINIYEMGISLLLLDNLIMDDVGLNDQGLFKKLG